MFCFLSAQKHVFQCLTSYFKAQFFADFFFLHVCIKKPMLTCYVNLPVSLKFLPLKFLIKVWFCHILFKTIQNQFCAGGFILEWKIIVLLN